MQTGFNNGPIKRKWWSSKETGQWTGNQSGNSYSAGTFTFTIGTVAEFSDSDISLQDNNKNLREVIHRRISDYAEGLLSELFLAFC